MIMAREKNCDILSCPCKNLKISTTCWTAAEQGDYDVIVRRIEANRSLINKFDTYGYSSLHYAAQHNHLKIVKYLIANGANVNANLCGATPLHRAGKFCILLIIYYDFCLEAFNGHYDSCGLLIDNGADLNCQDSSFGDFNTPLQKSLYQLIVKIEEGETQEIINNYKKTVSLLLSKGVDVNIKNSSNHTSNNFLDYYNLSEDNILSFSHDDIQFLLQQRDGQHFEGVIIQNDNNNDLKEQPEEVVYCQFIDNEYNKKYNNNNTFNNNTINNNINNNNENRGKGSLCSICFLEKLSFVKTSNNNLVCTSCSRKYIIGMINNNNNNL